ncbi:hypothetical protein OAM56_04270 [Alphaproteobacteria bacterium]|nr:hypothetical protein [Alphaproteobacteria bacterium]
MSKFFIIWLILFGLSSCITLNEKNEISKKVTNNQAKIDLSQNKFQNNVAKYKVIQWKCYKSHWLTKYKQLLLTVEYFPEFKKFDQNNRIGMLLLNDTNSKKLVVYSQQGVRHYWDWGGANFNNYQIIIHPSGNGWFFDFKNKKTSEEQNPKESYDCKPSQTTFIELNEIENITSELDNVPNFEIINFRNILQLHMQKCFKLNFPTLEVLKDYPIVTLQIFTNKDGVINKTNFVNKAKYENDIEYKNIADIVSNAVMNCSYLPIPKNKFKLFKNFIMDFDPKFIMEK